MTDDIVNRLRGQTPIQTKPCIRDLEGCCEICKTIFDTADEAADEIERLQKELEIYKDLYASEAIDNARHKMRWYPG